MKKLGILFLAATIFASCSSSKKTGSNNGTETVQTTGERDGSSFEKAIIINEKTEGPGVSAEYKWLKKNYPGYQTLGQTLSTNKGKPFDVIKIKTSDGAKKDVYFDISKFFGKLG